jgi:hypothetical protein
MKNKTVPMAGFGQGGEVLSPQRFSYTLDVDGVENTMSLNAATDEAARNLALLMFKERMRAAKATSGFAAVFRGDNDVAEPMGIWDYEGGQFTWKPRSDGS